MRPGPVPKPTTLKEKAGNPGKRPLNAAEPKVPVPTSVPYAPRFLSKEGKAEWRRMVKFLIDAGLYSEVDRAALAMYCSAWARWVAAERKIAELGSLVRTTDKGYEHQSAWVSISNKAADQLRKMIAEFGLSPAQRSRVVAMDRGDIDDLAEILRGNFEVVK